MTSNGSLLRTGNIKDYTPLGEEGNPVYKWADQIRVTIKRKISAESIHVFAIPQPNEKGDIIDWYAPESGSVIPWSSATRDEKISAKEQLTGIQQQLAAIEQSNQSGNSEQGVFNRLLMHVIQFPDDEHVYLVNGKPVLTFWGFVDADASVRADPLAILSIPELPKAVTNVPVPEPAAETIVAKRGFSWWWLALIPLLLLLFFLLRGCEQDGVTGSFDTDNRNTIDNHTEDEPTTFFQGKSIDGFSTSVEENITPVATDEQSSDIGVPEGEEPEQSQVPPEPEAVEETEEAPKEEQQEEPQQEEELPPEETEKNPDEPTSENDNPPLQALEIPENSEQQNSMDFLNGRWQADSGLMDKQGRPVKLEYDFKDGKGHVRIKKMDGTVCSGTVEANMKGKELTFSDNEVIKCPDGNSYQPAKVKCNIGDSSHTVCNGAYSGGENFKMNINKSE